MSEGYSASSENDIASSTSTAFSFGDGGDIIFGSKAGDNAPVPAMNNTMLYAMIGGFSIIVLLLILRR